MKEKHISRPVKGSPLHIGFIDERFQCEGKVSCSAAGSSGAVFKPSTSCPQFPLLPIHHFSGRAARPEVGKCVCLRVYVCVCVCVSVSLWETFSASGCVSVCVSVDLFM
jgi:hypothetical protein